MERTIRIRQLDQLLRSHRRPIAMRTLCERLECSQSTVKRTLALLRDTFHAPVEYNAELNGYHYAAGAAGTFELPGLWFNASELHALLTLRSALADVGDGLLDEQLAPLKGRIESLIDNPELGTDGFDRRIRMVGPARRSCSPVKLPRIAEATLEGKRLLLVYDGRGRAGQTRREISPQRLLHYREGWYLLAWCHLRDGLRLFALERMRQAHPTRAKAHRLSETELDAHLGDSYGIFSGQPIAEAELIFSPERARWVADETWHPEQSGNYLDDGRYRLTVPYSDPRELTMDILRHGHHVEVIAPSALRLAVQAELAAAQKNYSG